MTPTIPKLDTLTIPERRILIAEAMGVKPRLLLSIHHLPDYYGSLDAAITLADALKDTGWHMEAFNTSEEPTAKWDVTFQLPPPNETGKWTCKFAHGDTLAAAICDCYLLATGRAQR